MKTTKTIYMNLYKGGKIIHCATVRNDWNKNDWENLFNLFGNFSIRTTLHSYPIIYLINHIPSFNKLKTWKFI